MRGRGEGAGGGNPGENGAGSKMVGWKRKRE